MSFIRLSTAWRRVGSQRGASGAGARARAAVLVDGRRSLELVQAELRQKLLLGAVDVWAAGRQGAALALRAAAGERRFVLRQAQAAELEAAGLEQRGEGDVKPETGDRLAFRLHFDGSPAASVPEPRKVFQVGQSSNSDFIPLAKAIATELRWLPSGEVLAVESLMLGKAKNIWTRCFSLAKAVAQVYEWQIKPEVAHTAVRPFSCMSLERQLRDFKAHGEQQQAPRALRLVLFPEGDPPPRPDGSPGLRVAQKVASCAQPLVFLKHFHGLQV